MMNIVNYHIESKQFIDTVECIYDAQAGFHLSYRHSKFHKITDRLEYIDTQVNNDEYEVS